MTQTSDKKQKIQVVINGHPLTFNECIILEEKDTDFIKFSDKFGTIYRYNKNVVVSMEELR